MEGSDDAPDRRLRAKTKFARVRPAVASGKRRFRSRTMKINPARLSSNLKQLYDQNPKPGFLWNGSHYGNTRRGGGPDRSALAIAADFLKHLVTEAPNGYPCSRGVRDSIIELDRHADCLEDKAKIGQFASAQHAADRWKKISAMLYNCVGQANPSQTQSCRRAGVFSSHGQILWGQKRKAGRNIPCQHSRSGNSSGPTKKGDRNSFRNLCL